MLPCIYMLTVAHLLSWQPIAYRHSDPLHLVLQDGGILLRTGAQCSGTLGVVNLACEDDYDDSPTTGTVNLQTSADASDSDPSDMAISAVGTLESASATTKVFKVVINGSGEYIGGKTCEYASDFYNDLVFQVTDGDSLKPHFEISVTASIGGSIDLTANSSGNASVGIVTVITASASQGSYSTETIPWSPDGNGQCSQYDLDANAYSGGTPYSWTAGSFSLVYSGSSYEQRSFDLTSEDSSTHIIGTFSKDTDTRLAFEFDATLDEYMGSHEIDSEDPLTLTLVVGITEVP